MNTFRPTPRLNYWLPLGALAGLLLAACGNETTPSPTGSAELTVHALSAADVTSVTATVSGPALSASRTVTLFSRSTLDWGALIGLLPAGSNYVITVAAKDSAGNDLYDGAASNITIIKNQVTTVLITAQQNGAPTPFKNAVPVIDSLLVSPTSITPGATISAKATAHDPDTADTITFAWSTSPAGGLFSAPTATTTTWTAPATEGDVTLNISVSDNHGATTTASVLVHVSNSNGTGQASVGVVLNTWPVVSDMVVSPGFVEPGQPVSLTVIAADADHDPLTYAWTTTCASGVFSAPNAAATTFTLPAGATDTSCELDVAVADNRGGSTSGQTVLPVGKPVALDAPVISASEQSASVVDVGAEAVFAIAATDPQGKALTIAWSASGGLLSNQTDTLGASQVTWTAPATGSASFTVSAVVSDALGLSTQFDFTIKTAADTTACTVPASSAWKFGVMSDTQWTTADPAGQNPTTVAQSIIGQINPQMIAAGVKFVIQVGDLADTGNDADETVRANDAQALYDAGIGFFPMRGNHETYGTGNQFSIPVLQSLYPQTRGLSNTFGATNFSSPTSVSTELDGMSYSFDYNSVRFVIVDPWVTPSRNVSQAGYNFGYSITEQQPWITSRLDKTTRGTDHAFVMSHQPLMAENHQDTMFQGYTDANPDMQNAFYASMQSNGAKYFLSGHDHINQHSIIASPDGQSSVHELIGASDSSKFYTPKSLTDANWKGQKYRETSVAQEMYTVGYYIFTVDGPRMTVDFYSDNHGNWQSDASYPLGAGRPDTNITPIFTFAKKQTWGYSTNGVELLVPQGASYPANSYTFGTTTASILAGTNSSLATDYTGRKFTHAVDLGWDNANCLTASAILSIWGTSDVAAASGDTIALSISFDPSLVSDAKLLSGSFGLATQNDAGNWVSTVSKNVGGTAAFVAGPWNSSYGLGIYGVDPTTNTAWAVVNHAGRFAVAGF